MAGSHLYQNQKGTPLRSLSLRRQAACYLIGRFCGKEIPFG